MFRIKSVIFIFCLIVFINDNISAQWFNENSLNSTIAIEVKRGDEFEPYGTGFLLYNYSRDGYPVVITAGHILSNILSEGFGEIYVSVNAGSGLEEYANVRSMARDSIWFGEKNLLWEIAGGKIRTKIILQNKPDVNYIINES